MNRSALTALSALFLAAQHAPAQEILWNNPWNSTQTTWSSYISGSSYLEAADDFDAIGQVTRIIAHGMGAGCFICPPPTVLGVNVRFYEWTETGPGALQAEMTVPTGPNFQHLPTPETLDITLPQPFNAGGRHYLSVQVVFQDNPSIFEAWQWWPSGYANPVLGRAYTRSQLGGDWFNVNSGLAFQLFGTTPGGPPGSTDPCGDWEVVPSPPPPGTLASRFSGIAGVSQEEIWVVGSEHRPAHPTYSRHTLVMRWNGSQWERIPAPDPAECPSCPNNGLGVVAVVSPNDVWAAGTAVVSNGFQGIHSNLLVIRWNGSQWSIVPTPDLGGGSGGGIADIKVFGPNDVWFVGAPNPPANAPYPALAMRWTGSSFQVTPVPIVNFAVGRSGGNALYAVDGVAANDVWAVGATDVNAPNRHDESQIQHWNGSQWTHIPGPTPGYFNQLFTVAAAASNDVWAAGEYWDIDGIFPFLIRWNGSQWTQVDPPGGIRHLKAFAPNDVYGIGGDRVYHFNGQSWSIVHRFSGTPQARLSRIAAVGPCELWTAGMQLSYDLVPLAARLIPGTPPACPADWNGDSIINSGDISAFITSWLAGIGGEGLGADFNGDGVVNSSDISMFISTWLEAVQNGC